MSRVFRERNSRVRSIHNRVFREWRIRDRAIRDTEEAGKRGLVNAYLFKQELLTGVYARPNGGGRSSL